MQNLIRGLTGMLRAGIDLILPPRCPGTGEVVQTPGTVSPAFWQELHFIETPFCSICGIPFDFDVGEEALCGACLESAPVFDRARSAVVYNEASRKLILALKYGDRLDVVRIFAPWLARAGAKLLAETDMMVPVPLHPRRLWTRRFNQSALLSHRLSVQAGIKNVPDALRRVRATPPQKGMSRAERARNVRGAFEVSPDAKVAGQRILLIDDVLTSGATLDECARVLKARGAASVCVLTVARVTREAA